MAVGPTTLEAVTADKGLVVEPIFVASATYRAGIARPRWAGEVNDRVTPFHLCSGIARVGY